MIFDVGVASRLGRMTGQGKAANKTQEKKEKNGKGRPKKRVSKEEEKMESDLLDFLIARKIENS